MDRLKNRRGVTLVLMAFMLTVLIGSAAFAVDFGRMYLYRAQLHSASDAAALAGMFWAAQPHVLSKIDSRDTAIAYARKDSVDGTQLTIATTDVLPGSWNNTTKVFTPEPSDNWDATTVDAVQATTHYTGTFGFGKLFGLSTRALSATSVAVRGTVGRTNCVRPWAIPYQSMINELNTKDGGTRTIADPLLPSDVTLLGTLTRADQFPLKVASQNDTVSQASGNFYAVDLPPVVFADGTVNPNNPPPSGASVYKTAINSCDPNPVSVGDWLAPENGVMEGPTKSGITDLCGGTTCDPAYKVVAAIWDINGDAPGAANQCNGGKCFHVKYLGVFYITSFDNSSHSVIGYFSTMTTSGGFTPNPGPIQLIALVK